MKQGLQNPVAVARLGDEDVTAQGSRVPTLGSATY